MDQTPALDEFAELVGVETSYWDIFGQEHVTSPDTKRALLAALGYKVDTEDAVGLSLDAFLDSTWRRWLQPVYVIRRGQGRPLAISLTMPQALFDANARWTVTREDGSSVGAEFHPGDMAPEERRAIDGEVVVRTTMVLPQELPDGYHRFRLDVEDHGSQETRLVVAPARAYLPERLERGERMWGFACHMYSLRTPDDWGIGDFSELANLCRRGAALGAHVVGINPLHALYPEHPEHASPYSPSSRLFLNPLFINVAAVPEFQGGGSVFEVLEGAEFSADLARARDASHVDYSAVAACKWAVLERMHAHFRSHGGDERHRAFEAFKREMGEPLRRFALFQALRESQGGAPWWDWPRDLHRPDSPPVLAFAEAHAQRIDYVMYLQWLADTQLARAAQRCREGGMAVGLYRDLAVGMDPGGADAWSDPDVVVRDARFGAPPDAFNLAGQDWGMPPPHPVVLRERAYEPFIAMVRANMRHAGALRIDHVMGLLHLYWILPGRKASEGAYVAQPFDDLLGILALESHRNRCLVVGEDLGTVPPDFRARMTEEAVLSYRLFYFERWKSGLFLRPDAYPSNALATGTTHDLATIPGNWRGNDLLTQRKVGVIVDDAALEARLAERAVERTNLLAALEDQGLRPAGLHPDAPETDGDEAMRNLVAAISRYLARSPAHLVMLNLDDLMLERDQLNIPGTVDEYPNWRRRFSQTVDDLMDDPWVHGLTRAVAVERSGRR